jgi:hypothetical protein
MFNTNKVRINSKIKKEMKDFLEELEDIELEEFPKKEETKAEKEKVVLKEKPKTVLNKKVEENLEFLRSCVKPNNEEIIVKNVTFRRERVKVAVEYPILYRNGEEKLVDIAYLADKITRSIDGKFNLFKGIEPSSISIEGVMKVTGIKYSENSRFFVLKCIESSNSKDALALYLGYSLLLPRKVDRVEELLPVTPLSTIKKTMYVYTSELRDISSKLIGVGLSIGKYLRLNLKIVPKYY